MDEESIDLALRSAVGRGGSAESADSIDALWRRCQARAIASVADSGRRAAENGLPDRAIDLLPYYERLLVIAVDPATSEDGRRVEAAQRYTAQDSGVFRAVEALLEHIDERFTILSPSEETEDVTMFGRAFDDFDGGEPFDPDGTRRSTAFPNYSTRFVWFVVFELGDGVQPTADERRALVRAHKVLGDVLPAYDDFQVVTHRGFTLDVSRLDLTSFGA